MSATKSARESRGPGSESQVHHYQYLSRSYDAVRGMDGEERERRILYHHGGTPKEGMDIVIPDIERQEAFMLQCQQDIVIPLQYYKSPLNISVISNLT